MLLDAFETGGEVSPFSDDDPSFDVAAGYGVLADIASARSAQGWRRAGRKIGFSNRTIWEIYGVSTSFVADVWDHTLVDGDTFALGSFREPRIEPEVVLGLSSPVPPGLTDARDVLEHVEWMAAGFEIVQCPYPGWKFTAADCIAAFGLHGALVVGPRTSAIDPELLATFECVLSRDGDEVDRGTGANVLDSPALALAHIADVVTQYDAIPSLEAGELVTTGTVTNAHPIAPGQTWSSDYTTLGIEGLTVTFS